MLDNEKQYDFRKELLDIHQKDIRDFSLKSNEDDFVLTDGTCIVVDKNASEVILTAARDLVDYLFTSQGISARLTKGSSGDGKIYITTKSETDFNLGTAASYKGFLADISDKIIICGFDDRGAAQGVYFLEEEMSKRRAPYIKKSTVRRKPLFSPRMVHSGYGLDDFPDAHLNAIAHAGRDAILIFVKGVNMTPYGYLDFNNLIYRATKYGIDVYAYSYLQTLTHPDAVSADKDYELAYGTLFKNCPGLRGVILVGESIRFASRDPCVRDISLDSSLDQSNSCIPDSRPDPGWWPCSDYSKWVCKVRDTVRRYTPDADIVFWTYNWGWAPKEDRIKLINSLPTDISLLVTFEMSQQYALENVTERCYDYTLSFEGPSSYFLSEAEVAKKRGIRLYSMTNTGGLTWDVGTVPYLPTPQQWIKRYEKILKAHADFDLCGLMESHHYGFYPSFIGDLSNVALSFTEKSIDEHYKDILLKYFGEENIALIDKALNYWSAAIRHFVPAQYDQYGAMRIGPAYPLLLSAKPAFNVPDVPHALWGNRIVLPYYGECDLLEMRPLKNRIELSILPELRSMERALEKWEKGLKLLDGIKEKNNKLLKLINLGEYIKHTIITTINAKKWYIEKNKLESIYRNEDVSEIFERLYKILDNEYENAKNTIPIVEKDSRLGWEPSMEYIGHKDNIEWKLRQLKYVCDVQLPIAAKRFSSIEY